jgi:hypothetical protein
MKEAITPESALCGIAPAAQGLGPRISFGMIERTHMPELRHVARRSNRASIFVFFAAGGPGYFPFHRAIAA